MADERTGDAVTSRRWNTQCFGCAPDNPSGLRVEVEHGQDGSAHGHLAPDAHHEGPPGHLHGGLAATALDEIMGWAAHDTEDDAWVTGTLEVRYRKPVPLDGGPYRLEADTVKASGRRKRMAGRLLFADGTVAVEAEAVFIRIARPDPTPPSEGPTLRS